MEAQNIAEITDFSAYSTDELFVIIKKLQQENAQLHERINTDVIVEKKMSFRQAHAEKILDALPDMLTVITDNGTTVAVVSSEDTNHSGILRDDIPGVHVCQFLPDHVYGHVMESIDQAIKYGKSENLSHLMYVNGKPHYFENRTVRIDNDCNLCLCRDITEEMLAKIQLESLSYAINLVNESVFSLNTEGEFMFANKHFMKDHKQANVIGKSAIGILFSCQNEEQWKQLKAKINDNNGEAEYIYEHTHDDGTKTSYEVVVNSVRNINNDEEFWFFARNITQRLKQERENRELNAIMTAILDNIPIYLFVKDTTDFKYLYWNKALEEQTGIRANEAVGHLDKDLFDNKAGVVPFKHDDNDLKKINCRLDGFEEFVNKNGEKRIVKTIKVPVERQGKKPLIIGVALDITDMKLVEKQLISAKHEAEKSNQLKSAFLANMSHEIRTPLNAIVGFAKLILTEEDAESRQEYSDIIDSNTDLLLQLINDILDLSKIEAGTLDFVFKEFNISDLCSDMLEIHRMKTSEEVSLIYENSGKNLIIESDRNRLAQVFTNLLSNAIKFTASGEIRFGYSVVGDNVEVFVRDTGMGISAEKLPTIFDRFIKLNSFVTGTGLGLSITRTIIDRLGGEINVTSEEGKGSEFRFKIPYKKGLVVVDEGLAINEVNNFGNRNISINKSILIVEDDDSNYVLISKFLGDKYTCYRAVNGVEAVSMFKEYTPNLIFMDIKMPVMDGLDATKLIREISREVPIIALTAFAYESDRDNAIAAGCNHFLTKPLSFTMIQSMINKYIHLK